LALIAICTCSPREKVDIHQIIVFTVRSDSLRWKAWRLSRRRAHRTTVGSVVRRGLVAIDALSHLRQLLTIAPLEESPCLK
jgi:hypothetical protein